MPGEPLVTPEEYAEVLQELGMTDEEYREMMAAPSDPTEEVDDSKEDRGPSEEELQRIRASVTPVGRPWQGHWMQQNQAYVEALCSDVEHLQELLQERDDWLAEEVAAFRGLLRRVTKLEGFILAFRNIVRQRHQICRRGPKSCMISRVMRATGWLHSREARRG